MGKEVACSTRYTCTYVFDGFASSTRRSNECRMDVGGDMVEVLYATCQYWRTRLWVELCRDVPLLQMRPIG